jgi:hypothetical protein
MSKMNLSSPQYLDFYDWVHRPDNGLSTLFAATVFVNQKCADPEITDRIVQFWSGNKLYKAEMKGWLGRVGEIATYRLDKVSVKELARQRYGFATRLMAAAGYAGWALLIDEVELVGRYSLRQRAKSYAQIARLMGGLEGDEIAGLAPVLSITEDFESAVLANDEDRIPSRLWASGSDEHMELASQAETGMRTIRDNWERGRLAKPGKATIHEIHDKVRAIYSQAYDWDPPEVYPKIYDLRIRQYIKRWISEWDLRRLYPDYSPEIEITELRHDYTEMAELEQPSENDPDDSSE